MGSTLRSVGVGVVLLSLACSVSSFSRGASSTSCGDMVPGHIRAQPQDLRHAHVTLHTSTPSYLPGQLVTVSLRSSRDFMGFLLQARGVEGGVAGAGPAVVGGSWTLAPPGTHTLRCLSEGDALTHSDKQLKRNLSFVWRAPDEPAGDVRFYITVVQSYFVYWAGIESAVVHDGSRGPWRVPALPGVETLRLPGPGPGPGPGPETTETPDISNQTSARILPLHLPTSSHQEGGDVKVEGEEGEMKLQDQTSSSSSSSSSSSVTPWTKRSFDHTDLTSVGPPQPWSQSQSQTGEPQALTFDLKQTRPPVTPGPSDPVLTPSESEPVSAPQGGQVTTPESQAEVETVSLVSSSSSTSSSSSSTSSTSSLIHPSPTSLPPSRGSPPTSTIAPSRRTSFTRSSSSSTENRPKTAAAFPAPPSPPPVSSPPPSLSVTPSSSYPLSTPSITGPTSSSSSSSFTSSAPPPTESPRSTSPHLRPSPAPLRSLHSLLVRSSSSSPPPPPQKVTVGQRLLIQDHEAQSGPEPNVAPPTRPNLDPDPKPNPNPPSSGPKPKRPPPDQVVPRHRAWELGLLLGCWAGLGAVLVVGVRYVYRQACGKRTGVTLNDRDRDYGRGGGAERGLIHVQECGDLVRVRRIRENSFVLLAEYDILASPGD